MSFPTIVAWSHGAKYDAAAERLRARLNELGHAHDITTGVDLSEHMRKRLPGCSERQWRYRYTPTFLYGKLLEHQSVLYLHADMVVRSEVPVAWDGLDVGYQPREPGKTHGLDLMAAPLYFRAGSLGALKVLHRWRLACGAMDTNDSEHVILHGVIREAELELSTVGPFNPPIASPWRSATTPIRDDKTL